MKDVRLGVRNITTWLEAVFKPSKNQYGVEYRQFLSAEQEFNTYEYGIKGIIDGMIVLADRGKQYTTALEIKTGKRKLTEHRSQVMIYSLLISERFRMQTRRIFCCT